MKRFWTGVLAFVGGVIGGNVLGVVLCWLWLHEWPTYGEPGGVVLGLAQAVAGAIIVSLICERFVDKTLTATVSLIVCVVMATITVGVVGLHLYVGANVVSWPILATIVHTGVWIAAAVQAKSGFA